MRSLSPHHRPRRSSRLHLEALEDRCLLSTYAITDLGANLTPVALNNHGDVAAVTTSSSGQATAVLIKDGTVTTLTGLTPVVYDTGPSMGLNNSDQVVAGTKLWSNGTVTDLPIVGSGISDNGTIAGGIPRARSM
jgi:hypothetical protein